MTRIPLSLAGEPTAPPPGPPVLATGFRPFFLGAAAWAGIALPLWIVMLAARAPLSTGLLGARWHAHALLIGYAGAVLSGFLLTAARHWSGGRPTASNGGLLALVALWAAGRILHLPAVGLDGLGLLADGGWLVGLSVALGRPLIAARSRRNYGLVVAPLLLLAASAALQTDAAPRATAALVDGWLVVMTLISGRIVPMFTANALKREPARRYRAERALVPVLIALAVAEGLGAPAPVVGSLAAVGAVGLLGRLWGWGGASTGREPLLWILHAGCIWLGVAVGLKAVAAWSPVWGTAATHAATAGALGSLTLGMMARVTLGHTGRALAAGPVVAIAFLLLTAGAVLRVGAAVHPGAMALHGAGALWALAQVLWLGTAVSKLVTPRPDGRPG